MSAMDVFCCEDLRRAVSDKDVPVVYVPKFREFGIQVLDGGTSFIRLTFCPWSGDRLPESLREPWFDALEALGIDPAAENIPPEFCDERWYAKSSG